MQGYLLKLTQVAARYLLQAVRSAAVGWQYTGDASGAQEVTQQQQQEDGGGVIESSASAAAGAPNSNNSSSSSSGTAGGGVSSTSPAAARGGTTPAGGTAASTTSSTAAVQAAGGLPPAEAWLHPLLHHLHPVHVLALTGQLLYFLAAGDRDQQLTGCIR
jgi:hypothetical protein